MFGENYQENKMENKGVRYYTEEQVRQLMSQQEKSIVQNAVISDNIIETKSSIIWPEPARVVPVDKVKEVVKELDNGLSKVNQIKAEKEEHGALMYNSGYSDGMFGVIKKIKETILPDGK